MKEIVQKHFIFKKKTIHFVDHPFNVSGCDYLSIPFCRSYVSMNGFKIKKQLTSVIDLTQDIDTIWKKVDKKSTRYCINKAKQNGIKVKINENYDEFYNIYREFIKLKGIGIGFKFDSRMLKKVGTLFTYEYNEKILGGNLYLEDKENIRLLLSCSNRLQVNNEIARLIGDANRLAHWEAILYAKDKEISCFDFGGLWPEDIASLDPQKKSINSFKIHFGGDIVTYYNYEKIYSISLKLIFCIYKMCRNKR